MKNYLCGLNTMFWSWCRSKRHAISMHVLNVQMRDRDYFNDQDRRWERIRAERGVDHDEV